MKFLLSFLLCFLFIKVSSQPNYKAFFTTQPATINETGNYLKFSFKVENIGTGTNQTSHTTVYLNNSQSITNPLASWDISTEALAENSVSQNVNFIEPIPYSLPYGNYYLMIYPDSRSEVTGNINTNFIYANNAITLSSSTTQQNIPYPIILIHGLNSDYTTWDSLKNFFLNSDGFSFGGNMNFCLNQDGNKGESNLANDYKDYSDTTDLTAGDFYTINFNVDTLGNNVGTLLDDNVESNQSAIKKQGLAVRDAIKHVLKVTGRNKVILVGHSMGGLAAREYLQDSSLWQQPFISHLVAKLLTIGTPHGGSNATSDNIVGFYDGLDERSEAVRDLRINYYDTTIHGTYLFGGIEDPSLIVPPLTISPYYNVDVNCNGRIYDNIVGINNKPIPTDLSYTCIIGFDNYTTILCSNCDGVVGETEANLNNYLPQVNADTFYVNSFHTNETKKCNVILNGLDEPNLLSRAYEIDTTKYYFGNFTIQSLGSNSIEDSDYYKLTLPQTGYLNFEMFNIPVPISGIKILDSTHNLVSIIFSNGKGYLKDSNVTVNKGTYFIRLFGFADSYSWEYPYAFRANYIAKPIINPSRDTSICNGQTIILSAPTGYTSYKWSNGITTQKDTITITGNYSVEVIDYLGQISPSSDSVNVIVDTSLGIPTISKQFLNNNCDPQLLSLLSTTAPYYQWFRNDTLINSAISQIYVPLVSGIYQVKVSSQNKGCSIVSDTTQYSLVPNALNEIFVFNGNGNWTDSINWCNVNIPPATLPSNDEIIINPANSGECVLNTAQHIDSGSFLIIRPNIKFRIIGDLLIDGVVPTIITVNASSITQVSAISGGNIVDSGGALIINSGVCFSTIPNPSISDNVLLNVTGEGNFVSNLSGLVAGTTYYVRAFATNSIGTSYGNQIVFTTISKPIFTLGQSYGGGIIFYIDNTGKHGLIAAQSDQNTSINWSLDMGVYTGATGTGIGTGQTNTNAIVNTLNNYQLGYNFAANVCATLSLNGYSDWYLPSKDELNQLYINQNLIGGFSSGLTYWTSTEADNYDAWVQGISNGVQYINDKGLNCAVRAIRSF